MSWLRSVALLGLLGVAACAAEESDPADDTGATEDAVAEIGEEPTGNASTRAIVLAHGFDASDTNRWSFNGVAEALTKDGHLVQNRHDRMADHDPISSTQLQLAAPIVGGAANDGMVQVESAKWGLFRGCIPADHMDEVGQRIGSGGPALWSRFDHIRFYRRIAFGLDASSR